MPTSPWKTIFHLHPVLAKKKPEVTAEKAARLAEIESNIQDKPYITNTSPKHEDSAREKVKFSAPPIEEPPLPDEPSLTQSVSPPAPPTISEPNPEKEKAPQPPMEPSPASSKNKAVRAHWMEFIKYVKERKLWMSQVLQRADRIKEQENELRLEYDDHFNCAQLKEKENYNALTEFVLDFFQKELKVRIISPDLTSEDDSDGEESPHRQRQKLASDPLVIRTLETFSGQIGEIRIGPRSR